MALGGEGSDMGDRWAAWLLEHRFGANAAAKERMLVWLGEVRDRVLAGARIEPGDTVLDVGCGDGLLGVGAAERVGATGTVIFSDISAELLDRCREITTDLGVAGRCRFVHSGLPDLAALEPGSADVVLTRSVLIYVADKAAAFATMHRLLRPGRRLSIFEPINSFGKPSPPGELDGFDVTGLEPLAAKFRDAYRTHQPDDDPMGDFDERDLLGHALAAGFTDVHLEYLVDVGRDPDPLDWDTFLRTAPNPLVPTFGEVLDEALDPAERETLTRHLRTQLGPGARARRHAVAYLTARR
jgi:ubiquinone/menaquinone biosynthesis C-methylase UbiE